jgi:pimeloyl-ACP methyl ester carboxylesterase
MPLVFVHGVNVRLGRVYELEMQQRNQHFLHIFFKLLGRELPAENIFNPYWGDLATNLSPGNQFLPALQSAVAGQRLISHFGDAASEARTKCSLITMAKTQPIRDVFDLMIAAAVEDGIADTLEQAEELSKLAYRTVHLSKKFDTFDDQLDWLCGVESDAQFLNKLESELESSDDTHAERKKIAEDMHRAADWIKGQWIEAHESMKSEMKQMGKKVLDHAVADLHRFRANAEHAIKAVGLAGKRTATEISAATITQPIRKLFHERLFLFIGDSFLYFGQRGTPDAPGPIVARVIDTIERARQKIDPINDPELIVVAHSMGGNIVCDIASHFQPDRPIDLLITVGSQFPLFADLRMFPGMNGPTRPIEKPPNVKRWINIYDVNDVFGFAAVPLFSQVEDTEFASGRFGVTTHADCFKFVSLYELMAQTVLEPKSHLIGMHSDI